MAFVLRNKGHPAPGSGGRGLELEHVASQLSNPKLTFAGNGGLGGGRLGRNVCSDVVAS
jgi:hypothetical protein